MQTPSFLNFALVSLGLVATTSAYEITLWDGPGCTGASRYNNVWDNTCFTPAPGFGSVTVVGYSGGNQHAQFYRTNNCAGSSPLGKGTYGVSGSDPDFQIGQCIDFGTGDIANAAGSWA